MAALNNLENFHLYKNNFSGHFPQGFAYMPNLTGFSIYKNRFSGNFPREFGKFSPLSLIDISENEFTGEFPHHLCENSKLEFLLALDNRFAGEFPVSYSNCKSLTRIRVSQNLLCGRIPDGLWAMPRVHLLDLSHNHFTGGITSEIRISTNLSEIDLSNNRFSGVLPQEIGYLKKLERLVLSNNGEIPHSIRHLKQLSRLQMDGNSFSGSIPSELGECINLAQINLANNSLTGNIPSSISNLRLNSFNISRDKVSGLIPQSLTNLKLSLIDLSENLLSGVIPIELYMIGGFIGNQGLCLGLNLIRHFDSKIKGCNTNQSHKGSNNSKMLVLWYALPSTVALLIICFLAVLGIRRMLYTTKWQDVEDDNREWIFKIFQPRIRISVSDMQGLKADNIIGRGGEGIVYKLDLEEDGQEAVAVKLLQAQGNNKEMLKSFSKEIEILDSIRHKNILKLYAYFKKGRSHYLVLELMEKGNLYQALHGEAIDHRVLDMDTRYKIAVGVAQGIAYLHQLCMNVYAYRYTEIPTTCQNKAMETLKT